MLVYYKRLISERFDMRVRTYRALTLAVYLTQNNRLGSCRSGKVATGKLGGHMI